MSSHGGRVGSPLVAGVLMTVLFTLGGCAAPHPDTSVTATAQAGRTTTPTGPVGAESSGTTGIILPEDVPEAIELGRRWAGSRVLGGRGVVVVGSDPSRLLEVRAAAESAWRRCARVWPSALPIGVIVAPSSEVEAAAVRAYRAVPGGRLPADEPSPTTTSAPSRDASRGGATQTRSAVLTGGDASSGRPSITTSSRSSAEVDGSADRGASSSPSAAVGADEALPAASTIVVGRGPTARAQVHLSPRAWSGLSDEGRRIVLTHECVHVALADRGRPSLPQWLVEGTAEYVAYRDAEVRRQDVVRPLLARIRREGAPAMLPRDGDFDAARHGREELLLTYAEAATAVAVVVATEGEAAVLDALLRAPQGEIDALEARITDVWKEDLLRQAGSVGP